MQHFINKNEDVLVTPEDYVPGTGWVNLRPNCVVSGFFATCINSVGLFETAKASIEADYDLESTIALCVLRKLSENGFLVTSTDESLPSKYLNYDFLTLACLYGGNHKNFKMIKPFKLRSAYIQQEYNQVAIEEKISYLQEYGFISLGEYL